MKKLFFALMALTLVGSTATAQEAESTAPPSNGRTAFYAELGGPGILFSANIDTRFKNSRLGLGARLGMGFITESEYDFVTGNSRRRSVLTVPFQFNYIFGKPNSPHAFEAGAGVTWASKKIDPFNDFISENDEASLFASFSFMYRRQPVNGGFNWRIGFTPMVYNGFVQPSGAVGVGWSF